MPLPYHDPCPCTIFASQFASELLSPDAALSGCRGLHAMARHWQALVQIKFTHTALSAAGARRPPAPGCAILCGLRDLLRRASEPTRLVSCLM